MKRPFEIGPVNSLPMDVERDRGENQEASELDALLAANLLVKARLFQSLQDRGVSPETAARMLAFFPEEGAKEKGE